MVASASPDQIETTSSTRVAALTSDAVDVVSKIAVLLTGAGGVIHFAVIRHHLGNAIVTSGFVLIGGAQLLAAALLLTRPSPRTRRAVILLHTTVFSAWLLSRTVGLVVVPGAEDRAPVGVADSIANAFAVSVVVVLVRTIHVEQRRVRSSALLRVPRTVVAVIAVAIVSLTVAAGIAPHDHDHPATGEHVPEHDGPAVAGHDDHTHDHG